MRTKRAAIAVAVLCLFAGSASAQDSSGNSDPGASSGSGQARITEDQRARLEAKLRLADQIMHSSASDLQKSASPVEKRQWLREVLYSMNLEEIQAMGVPGGLSATTDAIARIKKVPPKTLGSTSTDLVYRPFPPCRFIDTRFLGGPILGARGYGLTGTGATNGGSAACNPVTLSGVANADDFAAVAMNVTIVGPPGAPGFLGARPVGSTNSTSLANWYEAGPTVQASNSAVVSVFQGAGNKVEFFGSITDVVVDIAGVFTRPDATALECNTVQNTVTVTAGASFVLVNSTCATGFAMTGGGCNVPTTASIVSTNPLGTTQWNCAFLQGGTPYTGTSFARCCRTPGR